MEFHERLQELRRQRGLTQEELAAALFVSRTAVSKWESGRGYPAIDSLKAISGYFSVSIDELLSSGEALTIAEADHRQQTDQTRTLVFGLLDLSAALLLFLPFFAQEAADSVRAVSLLALTDAPAYLMGAYWAVVITASLYGVMTLALQSWQTPCWLRARDGISLGLNAAGALLFILSRQPYAAVFAFVFLLLKGWMLLKQR